MSHRDDHDHSHPEQVLRTEALESLLIEKGLLSRELIDRGIRSVSRDRLRTLVGWPTSSHC